MPKVKKLAASDEEMTEATLPEKYVEIKESLQEPWWKDRQGFIVDQACDYVRSIVDKQGKINMDYADQAVDLATKLADLLKLK